MPGDEVIEEPTVCEDVPGCWADEQDDSSDPSDLPQALKHLRRGGVAFERAPKHDLATHGVRASISKSSSVYFTVDTVVTSQDILFGFDQAGIEIDDIVSIQRKDSNRMWVVSFKSERAKEQAFSVPFVTISECQVFIGDTENNNNNNNNIFFLFTHT